MFQRRFWMRGVGSPFVALAALFTTLCCLGFPALVGFLSALGAGFLLNDRYLEPLLAGTALGNFLSRNTGLVYSGAGIYFVVALALGAWFLFGPKREKREMDAACPTCAPVAFETHLQERSPMPDDLPVTRREALR
jgi:hypothetical protein